MTCPGPGATALSIAVDPAGRRASLRSSSGVLRPLILSSGAEHARVCLVPTSALLLAGDHVLIRLDVGPDANLEVVETAGTVAYDMRNAASGPGSARWDVDIRIGDGGSLRWEALPLVVATGADVLRTTTVRLGAGASLRLRETLVLGRSGEGGGRVRASLDVRGDVPILVESMDSADLGTRVVDSMLVLGPDVPAGHGPAGGMRLESGGMMFRSLTDETHLSTIGRDMAVYQEAAAAHGARRRDLAAC